MGTRPRIFRGIGASPGITVGRVLLLDRGPVRVPRFHIRPDQVDHERERLRRAIRASVEQLDAIRGRFVDDGMDHHAILEAHQMMVADEALIREAEELIQEELLNAEWAVRRVIGRLRNLLERGSDSYFRERRGDIDFVGERILRNLVGKVTDIADVGTLVDGTVVVAHNLSPVDAALLSRQAVTAFVIEVGGKMSHTSIVARSLEVPAVVGAHGVMEAAGNEDLVLVDGVTGTIILRPTQAELSRAMAKREHYHRVSEALLEVKGLPARTRDGHDILIAGNIELPTEVGTVLARGAEAIGLYRTEFMFIGRSQIPSEEDHYRTYCGIFDEVGEREVTIRTFDLGGEKVFGGMPPDVEPNPALGLRAVRYCLKNLPVFEAQLAGMLRAAAHGKLRILLPMISGVDELRAARDVITRVQRRLAHEGKEHRADVPIGVMVEVPSAVLMADLLAKECDFFAVGTNDLMQYLLAVDRSNERVDYLYHPLHPAVLSSLRTVVDAAGRAGIALSVCGEMAGDPEYTAVLVGMGISQLSMNAGSIPAVKRLVRDLDRGECKGLVEKALQCVTHHEAARLVREFLSTKTSLSETLWDAEEEGAP